MVYMQMWFNCFGMSREYYVVMSQFGNETVL